MKIYVPRDAAAKALGADEVAAAVAAEVARRGLSAEIVRNGTRGMIWLEPLVEIEDEAARRAFGPVAATADSRGAANASTDSGITFERARLARR